MARKITKSLTPAGLDGEINLVGALDRRMIALLQAIDDTGSISQAARQLGLSYKGAWLILENANNSSPKALITTAIGGSMGGGSCLTKAGKALLALYGKLDEQHRLFISRINQELLDDTYAQLLMTPLTLKNTCPNQLFGRVINIQPAGNVVWIVVELIGGERIVSELEFAELDALGLETGRAVILLIASYDVDVVAEPDNQRFAADNVLHCSVMQVRQQDLEVAVTLSLIGDDQLQVVLPKALAEAGNLRKGLAVRAVFGGRAVVVAAR
jgi:molybdate transport system regulatory protein